MDKAKKKYISNTTVEDLRKLILRYVPKSALIARMATEVDSYYRYYSDKQPKPTYMDVLYLYVLLFPDLVDLLFDKAELNLTDIIDPYSGKSYDHFKRAACDLMEIYQWKECKDIKS